MQIYQVKKDQQLDLELTKQGEYVVELIGEGAGVRIVSSVLVEGSDELNMRVKLIHKAKHTSSKINLRVVGKDRAKINLHGWVVIEKNCSDSNSFLEERVLLVSDQATASAVPDLEIKNNNVKCSHAVSVSRISPEQVFYLMSRGLNHSQAQALIVEGFLQSA